VRHGESAREDRALPFILWVCSWQDFEDAAAQFSFAPRAYFTIRRCAAKHREERPSKVGHDVWTFEEGAPEDIIPIAQTTDGFL
jgi:hypothetical protein